MSQKNKKLFKINNVGKEIINDLAILSIESDTLEAISSDTVIKVLVEKKCSRQYF